MKTIKLRYRIFTCLSAVLIVTVSAYTQPHTLPPAYLSTNPVSYTRTWNAVMPETNPVNITNLSTPDKFGIATQYVDGLGRPFETVMKQGSLETINNINIDMVMPFFYDEFGREQYKYLPFPSTATDVTKADGTFKLNPFQQQSAFYNNANGTNGTLQGQGETYFYSQANFEASPLQRVIKMLPPGNNWVGSGRGTDQKDWYNTTVDAVRAWTVTNSATPATFGSYQSTVAYAANQLNKTVTVDEQGRQLIEFKDKDGKVILKKTQVTGSVDIGQGSPHTNWLCTYYLYDDLGNLRCVVQPRGVELIAANWTLTDPVILAEQCFRYEYDSRNWMIIKKVPGAGQVNMAYDQRDRLVMTQDANLAATLPAKWMVTLYDSLNRPMQTGLLLNSFNSKTFAQHLTAAAGSTGYPFTAASVPATTYWEKLTITHYDDYIGIPSPLTSAMSTIYVTAPSFITSYNAAPDYAQPVTPSAQVKGLVTWTQVKVLGTASQFISQVNFYDDKARLIQVQSVNQTAGIDIATTQYDFSGKILRTHLLHQKAGGTLQSYQLATKNTYDILGRLTKIEKNINNTAYKIISAMEYDALGHLKKKSIGSNPASTSLPLETLSYDYNIRGWLLGENRDFIRDVNATNYFGFELGYDKNGSFSTYIPQYNGNISGTTWKSKGDNQKRKYDFTYDSLNRLAGAGFKQYVSGTGTAAVFDKSAGVDFSVTNMKYDANGNIINMNQNGLKLNVSPAVDQLAYTYKANTNKLSKVTDAIITSDNGGLGDFRDGANGATDDYGYDANGNLILDNNKGITNITYNYLNLPSVITVKGKGSITYTYDAAGNKEKKVTIDSTVAGKKITTTTTYLSGFVYESKATLPADITKPDYAEVLQFLGQEEGRIRRKTDATFVYDYFLKDHLGNVRMVLTEEQQKDIYPAASLEATNLVREQGYYNIAPAQIKDKTAVTGLPAYVNHNIIPNNPQNPTFDNASSGKVYMLNKSSQNIGLGMTLRVMSGDKIDIYGKSYYFQNNTGGPAANTPVTTLNILTGLLGGPTAGATNVHGIITASQLNSIVGSTGLIKNLFTSQTTTNNATQQVPKAFINYILFDEQFKSVGSGFAPLGANGVLTDYGTTPALHNIPVAKNGFVYIYCSNESPVDVFFDNIQVMQTRGPILEETHYYPFGLTMAGISGKAAGKIPNEDQTFQGQKFDDDLGINYVEFKYRNHDPQIGRFIEIDPLSDKYVYNSTYAFSENKVISHVELEGLESELIIDKVKTELANSFKGLSQMVDNTLSYFTTFKTSTEVSSTSLRTIGVGSTNTSTTSTNFFGNMDYLIAHNSNDGNCEPMVKTTTKSTIDQTTDIKTPVGIITNKTSIDDNGVLTQTTGIKGNVKVDGIPVTVSTSLGKSTDGQTKVGIQAALGTNNTKVLANGEFSTTAKQQSISASVGGQQQIGKTTVTRTFGIRFGW